MPLGEDAGGEAAGRCAAGPGRVPVLRSWRRLVRQEARRPKRWTPGVGCPAPGADRRTPAWAARRHGRAAWVGGAEPVLQHLQLHRMAIWACRPGGGLAARSLRYAAPRRLAIAPPPGSGQSSPPEGTGLFRRPSSFGCSHRERGGSQGAIFKQQEQATSEERARSGSGEQPGPPPQPHRPGRRRLAGPPQPQTPHRPPRRRPSAAERERRRPQSGARASRRVRRGPCLGNRRRAARRSHPAASGCPAQGRRSRSAGEGMCRGARVLQPQPAPPLAP